MQRVRISTHQSPVHKLGDAQMRLSPKFRLQMLSPPLCPLDSMPPLELGPLIPGLPDDVALTCLLRLPLDFHSTGRVVCRRWRHLLTRKEHFFTERRALGFNSPFLFTFAFHRCTGRIQWQVLDLIHCPVPERIKKPFSVNANGWKIYVVGRGLHVAIGFVQRTWSCRSDENSMKSNFSIQWYEIEVPVSFGDLTPSSTQVLFA
ncbi:F-box/kelch-repeat protein [Platanthera guangdongensis]|uniref:F-box/kelch-repeat protein n=1 Tax=Platanthera guangdongensis TaxID=2320717 RepID=A0ABR2MLV1_9ASPA